MPARLTHNLLLHPGIAHGFYVRQDGVSEGVYEGLNVGYGSGDKPEHIQANRDLVAQGLDISSEHLLSLSQIHSTKVHVVNGPYDGVIPEGDGLVTQTPRLAISALAADCGPVLLYAPKTHMIGAFHAGWRGALAGIAEATVDTMVDQGADRDDIIAVLGPCISQTNYEVGADFRDVFVAEDERYDRFFKRGANKPHFDLKAFIQHRLRTSGVGHVDALPDCTYAEPDKFYSYRYNTHQGVKQYGRNISVIMLKE